MTRLELLTAITALVAAVEGLEPIPATGDIPALPRVSSYVAPSVEALLKRALALPQTAALVVLAGGDVNTPENGRDLLGTGSVTVENGGILICCPFDPSADRGGAAAIELLEACEAAISDAGGSYKNLDAAGNVELRPLGWQVLDDKTLAGRMAVILHFEVRNARSI